MHPHPLLMQTNAMATMNAIQITIPTAGKIHQIPDPHHIVHHLLSLATV
jgi:hypothetical protein